MLNTYTVTYFFLDGVKKCNCYLSVSISASKNISGILFVSSLSQSMFVLPFTSILTQKCVSHMYLLAIYTRNKRITPYFFLSIAKHITFTFHTVLWSSIHDSYISSYFEISKYVSRYLVCSLFASKYVCFSRTAKNVIFAFHTFLWRTKHQSYFFFYFENSKYVRPYAFYCLFDSKYIIHAVFCTLRCTSISSTSLVAF